VTKETPKRKRFGLMVRKQAWVPTPLGWILLAVCTVGLAVVLVRQSCTFLSYHRPIQADTLIIEGWVPDYVLQQGLIKLKSGDCGLILTTGGPLSRGAPLSEYKTYAELSAASLKALGADPDQIMALPAPYSPRNRTRVSALEVQKWLTRHPEIKALNLMTLGPHARRSYWEFKRALPQTVKLGAICIPNEDFDSDSWWTSSAGIKTVVTEGLACLGK
jgi:hypothetical protein